MLLALGYEVSARDGEVVGSGNLMRPTDTHDASLLAAACCATRWLGIRCTGLRPSGRVERQ